MYLVDFEPAIRTSIVFLGWEFEQKLFGFISLECMIVSLGFASSVRALHWVFPLPMGNNQQIDSE